MESNNWLIQACAIAVAASATLNGAPFLPWLRNIKPRRIEARWVGYVGTFLAFGLWLALGALRPAWQAFAAYGAIWFVTLVPNTLIHMRHRDTGHGDDGHNPTIVMLPLEKYEEILEGLVDPRRDLTIALEALYSAALKARKIARYMPNQIDGQLWLSSMNESLGEAEERITGTREQYLTLFGAMSKAWHDLDGLRRQYGLHFSTP